jgi:hypothetical protein
MATPKVISVSGDSEIADVLKEADTGPVLLEKGGELYQLAHIGPTASGQPGWENYDSEAVWAAIDRYAGIWRDRDADAVIARVRLSRDEGTRRGGRP